MRRGSGPTSIHTTNVPTAIATTAGTNQAETASAARCMGALVRCASATSDTMRESIASRPTARASMTSVPRPLSVPPVTASPGCFSTGNGSPLSIDSSTAEPPLRTAPSTGTRSPGLTRTRSPRMMDSSGTSDSVPSAATRIACLGASASKLFKAALVVLRARSSSTCPRRTSVTMLAEASK